MSDTQRIFVGLVTVTLGTVLIAYSATILLPFPWSAFAAFLLGMPLGFLVSIWVLDL